MNAEQEPRAASRRFTSRTSARGAARVTRWVLVVQVVLLTASVPRVVLAQDSVLAEALFQDGRALMDKGDFSHACPKLAESQRLDPGTGTLLALAMCHEGEGKLASAWAEFLEVAGRASKENRQDREQAARSRAEALKLRLSQLTIALEPEAEAQPQAGLHVYLDGAELASSVLGTAFPVDSGEHRIEASAEGKQPWSTLIRVESTPARQHLIDIPLLEDLPPPSTLPPTAPAQVPPVAAEAVTNAPGNDATSDGAQRQDSDRVSDGTQRGSSSRGTTQRWLGGGTAVLGLVGIGVGVVFDSKRSTQVEQMNSHCTELYHGARNGCRDADDQRGYDEARTQALDARTIEYVAFGVGTAALIGGAVLYFTAPHGSSTSAMTLTPLLSADGAGVRIHRVW